MQKEFDKIFDDKFREDLVKEVIEDFKNRQKERKSFEKQWQLNLNFLIGNQYCSLTEQMEIEDYAKQYFWQEREVYNHIATVIESRLSKLAYTRPTVTVVPATTLEQDIRTAKISKNILTSVFDKLKISEKVSNCTVWSEICGSSFYKVVWDNKSGNIVGYDKENNAIYEGEVKVVVCPPYEIFPDNNNAERIEDLRSLIHAKVYDVEEIKNIWGIDVEPQELNVFSLSTANTVGGLGYSANISKVIGQKVNNHALVIERYEMPSKKFPNGRVVIIAGDQLVAVTELPFVNGENGERGLPFIRQCSNTLPASFWGVSLIERMIPVQRAYNAVKNRKHELLNRISMGILNVEEGSVDTDNLEEEGLSPGKVLIYRQGTNPPTLLDTQNLPDSFQEEEDRLLEEFTNISGTTELLTSKSFNYSNLSGLAIQLINEVQGEKLTSASNQIKSAMISIGKNILRLYKQFATSSRVSKIIGTSGNVEMFYWNNSDITSDDVVLETTNEVGESLAQRRDMVLELINNNLLQDEDGKMSNRTKSKVLEMLGFGAWENRVDLGELHARKADGENLEMLKNKKCEVLEIDDHKTHIDEHISFMLNKEFENNKTEALTQLFLNHIREHKKYLGE